MASADDIIQARRAKTDELLERVRVAFLERLGPERDSALGSHTTVYVTGSCGRGDMGAASDLDPYVVSLARAMVRVYTRRADPFADHAGEGLL